MPCPKIGRRLLSGLAALAVGTLVTSCSSEGGPSGHPPAAVSPAAGGSPGRAVAEAAPPPKVPESGLAKGLALPLEAYMLNYSDELTLERAEYRLTSACMAERGFKYDPPAVGGNPPESSNDSNMPRRYGISDPEESARLGYHTRSSQRPSDTVAPISEAERTALLGVGKPGKTTGGCVAESRKKLQITFGTKASELNRASLDTSLESPEIQDLMRQWSDCMKSRGYSYADVYAPLGQFNQSSNSGIGEAERQTAAVDIECKKKTGMVEKWFAKEVAIQNQLIEQNQLSLTKEKEDLERAIKNSADLH